MQKMRTFKSSPVAWRMCLALVANMALGKQAWQSVVCQSLGKCCVETRKTKCLRTRAALPRAPAPSPHEPVTHARWARWPVPVSTYDQRLSTVVRPGR
jgi:hypothetical protein